MKHNKQDAIALIQEERLRQKWSDDHDDDHKFGEIAVAAAQLLVDATDEDLTYRTHPRDVWGLVRENQHDRLRQLVIAGALVAAVIDRVLRASDSSPIKTGDTPMDNKDFVKCMCDAIGRLCGAATPCGIPGVEDAIRKHDWAKVAALLIQGGICAISPAVIIAMLIAAVFGCIFGEDNEAEMPDAVFIAALEHHLARYRELTG